MERSYDDVDFITEGDKIIGVNLGFSFASEHECGIRPLQKDFGLNLENELGFEARRNTIVPEKLIYAKGETAILAYTPYLITDHNEIRRCLHLREEEELAAGWSEDSFGLNSRIKNKEAIRSLYEAFKKNNGVITLAPKGIMGNSGLCLLDYDKIPADTKELFRTTEKTYREEQVRFRQIEKESGVYEALKKAGKEFYSCRIQRRDEKGNPLWWLNPREQDIHNYGWFSTEDLLQWAEDKGRVIMQKKEVVRNQ